MLASRARPAGARVWLALCTALAFGCGRSCAGRSAPVLATLQQISGGTVERDDAQRLEHWGMARRGAPFGAGDGVRTGPTASAQLEFADGSTLRMRPNTAIRFLPEAPGQHEERALDVRTGEALLIAGGRELSLRTHVGVAVLAPGTQLRIVRLGAAVEYHVEFGALRFRSAQGDEIAVAAGETVSVGIGMAVLHRDPAPPAQPPAEPAEPAEPAAIAPETPPPDEADSVQPGESDAVERALPAGPDYSSFGVRAGESFTVHAPQLPVAVSFDFRGRCKGAGEVDLGAGRQRARGSGSANLLFDAGTHRYTLHCLDDAGAPQRNSAVRGSVRVLRDEGTRRLPTRPPTSLIDADGRAYTVYYQNQLPDISVRWPNPPASPHYELMLDDHPSIGDKPMHLFTSGSLSEGVHHISFAAAGRRSRTTAVEIRFDNAAPKASLTSPADRAFSPGDQVKVEGVALPAWKVSVEGGSLTSDANDRFSGAVETSAARPNVTVRLWHPRLGIHYYLRRAAGAP